MPDLRIFQLPAVRLAAMAMVMAFTGFPTLLGRDTSPSETRSGPAGINLAGPNDWNTELPFIDLMHFARPWVSQIGGVDWGQGPPLELDPRGFVVRLPAGGWAEAPLISWDGRAWPSGVYHVLYRGKGRLGFGRSAVEVIEEQPGRLKARLDGSRGSLHLHLLETDPSDPVRDIRVLLPGFEQTVNPWHPGFLGRWKGISCIRYMDFMETNNSPIRTWEDRPQLSDCTFAGRGVPLELLIDLSNRLQANPWVCIPHQADDRYVAATAEMLRDRLDPRLVVHLEYSNEVWNPGFRQFHYAVEMGLAAGLSKEPAPAAWLFTTRRSMEIFKIFGEVFGGTSRICRILPCQSGNLYMAERMLDFAGENPPFDAVAIAPYVGMSVPETTDRHHDFSATEVAAWDLNRLFSHLENAALPKVEKSIRDFSDFAQKHGLSLIAYEGGQHLVGIRGGENNANLTALFQSANRHPRMGGVYHRLLESWSSAGSGLFCHFSSVARWSKWGSWGLMEYCTDDPKRSPKFSAFASWAARNGHPFGDSPDNAAGVKKSP